MDAQAPQRLDPHYRAARRGARSDHGGAQARLRRARPLAVGPALGRGRQDGEATELLEEAMRRMLASPEPDLEWLTEALENATLLAVDARLRGPADQAQAP